MKGLLVATSFLTRLPADACARAPEDLARATPWFPVVGGLLGLALAGSYAAGLLLWPGAVAAVVTLAIGLLLTRAFHEDGLADLADALGGSRDRAGALSILRDPRLGTYGGAALALSVLVRAAALATLDAPGAAAALPAGHALSRAAAIVVLAGVAPARGEGLGAAYGAHVGRAHAAAAAGAGLAIAAATMGVWGVAASLCVVPGATLVTHLAVRRLGGVTGDVLGALQQVGEASVLLLAAGLAANGLDPAWWAGRP
jgi:adenosylcobinamide-GDP ribazoletransferase